MAQHFMCAGKGPKTWESCCMTGRRNVFEMAKRG